MKGDRKIKLTGIKIYKMKDDEESKKKFRELINNGNKRLGDLLDEQDRKKREAFIKNLPFWLTPIKAD